MNKDGVFYAFLSVDKKRCNCCLFIVAFCIMDDDK